MVKILLTLTIFMAIVSGVTLALAEDPITASMPLFLTGWFGVFTFWVGRSRK